MKILLSIRQIEIVKNLSVKKTVEDKYLLEKLLNKEVNSMDIELLCSIINCEFMMNGIQPNFEPNAYGLELEDLLDLVNRGRLANM